MTDLPICLVIGIDGKNPEDIIKGTVNACESVAVNCYAYNFVCTLTVIIGDLPSEKQDKHGLSLYQWDISNKYYDASINFCKMNCKTVVDEEFSENVNASILYLNSLEVYLNVYTFLQLLDNSKFLNLIKENALKKADEWIPFLNEFDNGVKILVCEQCSVEGNSKHIPKINGINNIIVVVLF